MINNALRRTKIKEIKTLNYQTSCIREHRCFIVIAISMKTVNLEIFPQLTIYGILLSIVRSEINKHRNGAAGNQPPADTNM